MDETEFPRPPAPGLLIAFYKHGDRNSTFIFNNGLQLPHFCARKSMGGSVRIVRLGAEPGKTDGDSAANRLAFLPARLRAYEEHLIMARWDPGCHLGAVQIYLAGCKRAGDLDSRQRSITFTNFGDTRNS